MKRKNIVALLSVCLLLLAGCTPATPENTLPRSSAATASQIPTETVLPTQTADPSLGANPFSSGDFVREGQWMTCRTADTLLGVDVSKYQGKIDWQAVADAGIRFAMIRLGGRGYGLSGSLYADETARLHYEKAKAAGLQVGAYFFSQAITPEEAREEAAFALTLIRDWELDLPVAFDWEYIGENARTAHTDAQTVTACADSFCAELLKAGVRSMVYFRPEQACLDPASLASYPHWIGLYSDTVDYPYEFTMWQYTAAGTVPGISGAVDLNILIL